MNLKFFIAGLLLILSLGFILRFYPMLNNSLVDPDNYFHARLSEQTVQEHSLPKFDELSLQGRFYSYPPLFHILFAVLFIASNIPIIVLINFLPNIYGVLGILLVFVFTRRIFGEKIAFLSAFILAITLFHIIRTFSSARPDGLSLLIVPAIIFLLYLKKFRIAYLLSIAQTLLHPLSASYLVLFLLAWLIVFKIKKLELDFKKILFTILLIVVTWILWLSSLPYPLTDYFSFVSFESSEASKLLFIHFFTFFTFSWIFILIGLFKLKENLFLKLWFVVSLLFGVFALRLGIFLSIPAAIIAGFGLNFALEKIRPYTGIFFVLLLVLALVSLIPLLDSFEQLVPVSQKKAIEWLKNNSSSDENIFSQWDQGHPLAYLTQRKQVIDGYFEFAPELEERNQVMKELIESSNCKRIEKNVKKFNANYFFIHKGALNSLKFQTGILEAKNCPGVSSIFSSNGGKIIQYSFD